jgi:hypothetical protein
MFEQESKSNDSFLFTEVEKVIVYKEVDNE